MTGPDRPVPPSVTALDLVRTELDGAGIPASPEEAELLVGIRQLVRSRADLLFAPEVDRYVPADVFRADVSSPPSTGPAGV